MNFWFCFLENLLKLFRKDKLLTDNDFYQWVRNYQINADDDDDSIELLTVRFSFEDLFLRNFYCLERTIENIPENNDREMV